MKRKYLLLLSLCGFIVSLDQMTKLLIQTRFQLHETLPIIKNFFNITYVRNFGAAFGLLSRAPSVFRVPLFIIVPLIALIFIVVIFHRTERTKSLLIASLALILGGAVGNFIDRIRFSYVIDFLDFYMGHLHWPAFNVADVSICLGVAILILQTLHEKEAG